MTPMEKQRRRELVASYKEAAIVCGIIAVRCAATGDAWVASSRNLKNRQNGIWFSLRQGNHPNRALQAAFNAHGEAAFSYEVVETLPDEELTLYLLGALLKERAAAWRLRLGAGALTG